MSEKRRDNKNRILQTGESQRKDGRYVYKYNDNLGQVKFVYAWRLVPTDKTPSGKREDLSLREKEKEIQRDLDDGIDTAGKKMTVCELYAMQIRHNGNVKPNTVTSRNYLMKNISEDRLGSTAIENIKMADAKEWVLRMKENGYAFKTIKNYKRSLSAAFHTAVQNDFIRKNPFEFDINDVIEDDTVIKEALSPEQEKAFLNFIQSSAVYNKHYEFILILLGTGLRVSELCGLTLSDVDMKNRTINVNHQVLYDGDIGYYISEPKTKNGIRQIPMSETVYAAFSKVLADKPVSKYEILYDNKVYTNFIFSKSAGKPYSCYDFTAVFMRARKQFKRFYDIELPKSLSPHTMRHTFCTKMANAGMNPKSLQYLMGHANITMTLNYYTHATYESARDEFDRIMGKAQIMDLPKQEERISA